MHRWWVFLHIAGAFGFLMAHGVSVYVTLRLPKERDPARVSQLLELSASSVGFMWNSIGLLLIGGIAAGFTGHFWGQGWIWAAIVVLVVVMAAMYAMGTTWAKRLRTISGAMVGGRRPSRRTQFEEILRSKRPYTIAAIGFVGLLADPVADDLQADARVRRRPRRRVSARRRRSSRRLRRSTTRASSPSASTAPADRAVRAGVRESTTRASHHNVAIYADDLAERGCLRVGDRSPGPTTLTV